MIRLPLKNCSLGEARALIVGVLSPWVLLGFAATMAQDSGAAGQPRGKSADNLNGMDEGGDKVGRKILPLGQGERDLGLLRIIRDSGYRGPIGILGHTEDDAEARLLDNLDGLDWLLPQLDGKPPGPSPKPRTPVTPRPARKDESAPATISTRRR